MNDSAQTYTEFQQEVKSVQADLSKDDVMDLMGKQHEYVEDLDNLPKQQHNWVNRGAVMSCEGALHPYHRHFLVKRGTPMPKS